MIELSFTSRGRKLTYGTGVHHDLSEIAKAITANTGAEIAHWTEEDGQYTLYFLTNGLIDLVLTKGDDGMDMIVKAAGIQTLSVRHGLYDARMVTVDL